MELRRLTDTHRRIALDRLDEGSVSARECAPNVASTPSAYAGEYHFGDSEWESSVALGRWERNTVMGVLGDADWETRLGPGREVRFEGGTVTGARFSAPGWRGVSVLFRGDRA